MTPHDCRFTQIRISYYDGGGDKSPPELSGTAKQLSYLPGPLLRVLRLYMVRGDTQHTQVRKLLKNPLELEQIVKQNLDSYKYPAAVAERYLKLTFEMMDLKRALTNFYHQQQPPVALFHITVKCHYLVHIALLCKYLNPSRVWNYSGEAMMKRLKALIRQNTDGAAEDKPG